MTKAIKHQQTYDVKKIIEYCFQYKKVQLIESALLEYNTKINLNAEEGGLLNWMYSLLNCLVKLQI